MNDNIRIVSGLTFVATLPEGMGSITALRVKEGALVASTSSGVDYVFPNLKERTAGERE